MYIYISIHLKVTINWLYLFCTIKVNINYGILKEKAKKYWKQDRINNPDKIITVKDGIKHFIKVKKEIKRNVIINSFKKSCFNEKYIIWLFIFF